MRPYPERPWSQGHYHITVWHFERTADGDPKTHPKRVSGWTCWPFGARRTDGGGWSLDHLPTGATLGGFKLLAHAKDAARSLTEETDGVEPWEQLTDVRSWRDNTAIVAAIRAVMQPVVRVS